MRALIVPAPSPVEAAAIVAALERFNRDTAAPRRDRPAAPGGWLRAARLEAVASDPQTPARWGEFASRAAPVGPSSRNH